MKPSYSLASSTWDEQELVAIQNVIQTGKFSMGEYVSNFEKEFADYTGSKFAVMVNSGSSAEFKYFNNKVYTAHCKIRTL